MSLVGFTAVILTVLLSCANNDENNYLIGNDEVICLKDSQVSNFLYVLPFLLDFSEKYRSTIPQEEQNSPEFNKKFFKTLKDSTKFKDIIRINQFKSVEECLLVYKNVILAYANMKKELTNYNVQIGELSNKIYTFLGDKEKEFQQKNLSAEDLKMLRTQLKEIESDKNLYENIVLVHKYESSIDAIQMYESGPVNKQ